MYRKHYHELYAQYNHPSIIKIITGIRRSGKSTFLKQLIEEKKTKDSKSIIVYINMEDIQYDDLVDYKTLYNHIITHIGNKKTIDTTICLYIDEIQMIDQREKTINSLLSTGYYDITITGSNSSMLSSELSTLLTGRYVHFQMHPFSFSEYTELFSGQSIDASWKDFINYGSLPPIVHMNHELGFQYLTDTIHSILYRDIISRYSIRNVEVLNKVIKYIADNIGQIHSSKKIADYLKSEKIQIGVDSLITYISYLLNAYIINKCDRFDIKGKTVMKTFEKYYFEDIGIRNILIGYKNDDISQIIENIIYNELRIRGYKVYIGKYNNLEIDFVAIKNNKKEYYQVCLSLNYTPKISREYNNLLMIQDNLPKYILTLDENIISSHEGIFVKNIKDWLLEQ